MQKEHFYKLKQNQFFNDNLICFGTRETDKKNAENAYEIKSTNKEFMLTISENNHLTNLNLIFITMVLSKLTEKGINNYYNKPFMMTLKEYAEYRNLKSSHVARCNVKNDLRALFDMYISINIKNLKTDFRIISEKSIIKNSVIYIWFTPQFLSYYSSIKYLIYLPKELFKINVRDNPNTFGILWKLLYHYNINENKGNKNSDCLSVSTLLEYCSAIPHYDDTFKAQGGLSQRIIKPFIRDLDAINIIDWYFLDEKNNIVAKNSIKSYLDFITLKVKFEWTNGYLIEKSKKRTFLLCEK